uniref:Uncharacterized protein n=2 Tax=viral metagenome TaxID=1070528 RepID=A0A6M3IK69_9ZZZZ
MANKKHIMHFLEPSTTELSPFLAGDNQLMICNGVNPSYHKGTIKKDLGYSQVGSTTLQSGKPIRSLHHFRQSSSVDKILATVDDATSDDTQLFYSTGGNWTEITDAETAWANEATMDVEMEDFISYCFFVGYSSTDGFLPVGSLTGTTFSTSTNVTNMPGAKYIKRYRDRLYIGNCDISGTAYPYRVYFSSVPSAGSISWTVASDFIDVDYSEQITGIAENWDVLTIFTEFSAYQYDQSYKKKVWDVGCAGQRTIQNAGAYMFFANKDNVYVSTGGRPEPVGNAILGFLRGSTPSEWRAALVDNEYHLYVGDSVSVGGLTYSNVLLSFNIDSNMWRWRELYDSVDSMCRYTASGDDFLLLGCADSEIMKKSKYTDTTPIYADDGQPISAHFRTKAYDMGDPTVQKKIIEINAYSEYGQGMTIRYRIFNKNREVLMPFTNIGTLSKVVNQFKDLKKLEGNFIQFECKERSSLKAFSFYGFSMEYELATNN